MTTAIPRFSPLSPSEIEEDRVQEGGIIVERQILLLPETENAPAKIKDPRNFTKILRAYAQIGITRL